MVYSKATVRKMVERSVAGDGKVLGAFCDAIEHMDRYIAKVARYGYDSQEARGAFMEFAGNLGTLDARITNAGYVRPRPPEPKKSPVKKKYTPKPEGANL